MLEYSLFLIHKLNKIFRNLYFGIALRIAMSLNENFV